MKAYCGIFFAETEPRSYDRTQQTVYGDTIQEVAALYRGFITTLTLGASQVGRCAVLETTNVRQVCSVSYNGRLWDLEGNELPTKARQ